MAWQRIRQRIPPSMFSPSTYVDHILLQASSAPARRARALVMSVLSTYYPLMRPRSGHFFFLTSLI
ncbi:hypothetical protein SCLCIDRAFT_248129 [Scleroderma citrinum Foug A]|uniref:Uncharacterized protein n=1 Tax=Scleroderma citrinum Foug A TaxID=1036808 RepID=A0A0C2ZUX7_9AGAM|nr:hypothetical protein SCLCIDRAFT_248129 [Scleroderma citrinum Foug A]